MTETQMLDAALEYAARGEPVFPLWHADGARCGCRAFDCDSPGKHPVGSCAPDGVKDATTDEAVIRRWWERFPRANIGTRTGVTRVVLDVDPDKGGRDSLARLVTEHGPLPETAKVLTGGGGEHYHFAPVAGLKNSAGKIGPGLDVRGESGYVVLPPSNHVSGGMYIDDVMAPMYETPLATMPPWLVTLASTAPASTGNGNHRTPAEWAAKLTGAPEGQRRAVATEIAGHFLGRALPPEEVEEILIGFAVRCTPPFPEREARDLVRDFARRDRQKQRDIPSPAVAGLLDVPEAGLLGIARDFADLYAERLESPRAFFYFAFLTYVGALMANKITLDSALQPEPRLFTVLLGESADTRKSTALRKTDEFFRSLGAPWAPRVLFGVGSAEGIAAELKDCPALLLHFDELKGFVDKAKSENSVALPMVSTLFERGDYDNRTKGERLMVRDASLSLLAACTAETYGSMFDSRFFAIGFLNRLWLVSDRSTRRIAVPAPIPYAAQEELRGRVIVLLERVHAAYDRNAHRPVPYQLTAEAQSLFEAWYGARTGSIFERRLDTYGHRLMLLLAATSGREVIDAEVVRGVIALLRYQLEVRRESDPVDAENVIASLEEKIRRILARGALKGRDLKKRIHYERVGIWAWETAAGNLLRADEIAREPKSDVYWLKGDEAVPTPVPTKKQGSSADGA